MQTASLHEFAAAGFIPVRVKQNVYEGGGDRWQCVRIQAHYTELILRNQHRMNCCMWNWTHTQNNSLKWEKQYY